MSKTQCVIPLSLFLTKKCLLKFWANNLIIFKTSPCMGSEPNLYKGLFRNLWREGRTLVDCPRHTLVILLAIRCSSVVCLCLSGLTRGPWVFYCARGASSCRSPARLHTWGPYPPAYLLLPCAILHHCSSSTFGEYRCFGHSGLS